MCPHQPSGYCSLPAATLVMVTLFFPLREFEFDCSGGVVGVVGRDLCLLNYFNWHSTWLESDGMLSVTYLLNQSIDRSISKDHGYRSRSARR